MFKDSPTYSLITTFHQVSIKNEIVETHKKIYSYIKYMNIKGKIKSLY